MRSWIAGATVAIAMATPLSLRAQDCDPQSLLGSCAHAAPAEASFVDLVSQATASREADASAPALVPASQSVPIDAPLAGLAIPAVGPAPGFAWVLALGFLGLIVMRRTRAARAF